MEQNIYLNLHLSEITFFLLKSFKIISQNLGQSRIQHEKKNLVLTYVRQSSWGNESGSIFFMKVLTR